MFNAYPALLITKLYRPHLRAGHVPRAGLLAALDAGAARKLIVIAAAAGFGKTALMAEWCAAQAEDVGWLSLDEGDNDPARFLSYLIAAIQSVRPEMGGELLAALQAPPPTPAPETALHTLINQLAAAPKRLILILDDYHVISSATIHHLLAALVDHLPPQMTLVLLTRTDPPLPLARLRANGDLLELRASALRFSPEEAAQFLNQTMGLNLSTAAITALEARTEGWIAGLQLAALALQSAPQDREAFIREFTGSHRFVLDYLIEEVLAQQPENVRRFLLHTAILTRMNAALCRAVTGEADSQAMLDALEKHNLFLIALDHNRQWYRYHHLFADLLEARLMAEAPHLRDDLCRRAARWFTENDLPEEAISYALAAKDYEMAAELIIGPAAGVTRRGDVMTLLEWYQRFPPDFVRANVSLSLQFGVAFALNGRWDEAEDLLAIVEAHSDDSRPDEALLLAYLVASHRQDAARLNLIAQQASAAPHPDRVTKMVLALLLSLKGELQAACALLAEAQDASARAGDDTLATTTLFHLCRFCVFLGDLQQAYALCQMALAQTQTHKALPMVTLAHGALGRILIEWHELDAAEDHLRQAIDLGERSGFVTGIVSSALMMLAEVQQGRGSSQSALELAQQAIAAAERYDPPQEVLALKTYQARLWLAAGNFAAASEWLRDSLGHPAAISLFYPPQAARMTQARALLAARRVEEAVRLLTRLIAEPHHLFTVEALAALALARQSSGDSVHALLTLEQALTLAASEKRIRVFLDFGVPMAKLLAQFAERQPASPARDFTQALLPLFPANTAAPIDPLGERELEILRLIAAGHSNDEIAQMLTLALSTVKWYINTLYAKLHVKTRAQAIARAHELKLIARG